MKKGLVLICLSLSLLGAFGGEHWGYSKGVGPRYWGKLSRDYEICKSGKTQSPINIQHYYHSPDKEDLSFEYENTKPLSIAYSHYTLVAQFNEPGNAVIFRDHEYSLVNLHFHIPMEFAIHGKKQPLSMHLVHRDKEGDLLVVGIGFSIGKKNPFFTPILNAYKYHTEPKLLALKTLLPDTIHYYHFNGSLTTPPCSEGVTWFIIEETLSISKEQFDEMQQIMHHQSNQRPLQKDYNRVIVKSSAIVREH
ncbi:carbonic anhydrase [Helicobacter ailurogastricus]|uniref:carbonic anhydrase n=1 Tax=Helicobacter ailurogastricus TaxID=1578720 RepID=A0A0K2Y0K9_9HELI|nr:carbonic anhydrase family protein [Helicobacter ailurogastricus]CRF52836.1 Carbonic anhydrase [Helicobacter ailurogastricus]